jgi:DNA-binding response OmpR family regulator
LVTVGTENIHLTPTEYRLLMALATHVDQVLSRETLLQQVWGFTDPAAGHVVDVALGRLRKKLRRGRLPPPDIVTVRGSGYRLASVSAPPPTPNEDADDAG